MRTVQQRLFQQRRIDPVTECWEWQGTVTSSGYGRIMIERKRFAVHRLAAHLWLGLEWDSEQFVCHDCDNPRCFNPDHLFIGTALDNMRDMIAKGRATPPYDPRMYTTAKVSEDDVRRIRDLRADGKSLRHIGKQFGVSYETVRWIAARRSWKFTE